MQPAFANAFPVSTRHETGHITPLHKTATTPRRHRTCRRPRTTATYQTPLHPPRPPYPHRTPDYYANVGTVIDTLRTDVPQMLTRPPELSIYTDTLTFSDGSGYRVTGKEAYKTVLWILRAQVKLVFTHAFVEILSMFHDDFSGSIHLRWRMTATPRWGMNTCVIDGVSVYRLDREGWVYEHSLENAVRRRDRRIVFANVGVPVSDGRVVGVGAGAGGLPGWYRSLFDTEFVPLEIGDMLESEEEVVEAASLLVDSF